MSLDKDVLFLKNLLKTKIEVIITYTDFRYLYLL